MLYDPYTSATHLINQFTMSATLKSAAEVTADEAFEREKAAITSYEEGWDRWDGPIWPIGYVQCHMRKNPSR
jgi:hypothetical protein